MRLRTCCTGAKLMPKKSNCQRCGATGGIRLMVISHPAVVRMCNECADSWYDLRDKIVREAFVDFTSGKSSKG